jgi:uncharacterized protein (DUF2252 family)
MMVSPFTFYRGTADIMAADLAPTPVTGLRAQLCGACHLLNFGGFATPERQVIFDMNDFDETLPGPWEWDVKRLATSFVLAARSNGFSTSDQRRAALACAQSYRDHMADFAGMRALDVWYAHVDLSAVLALSTTRLLRLVCASASNKRQGSGADLGSTNDGHRQTRPTEQPPASSRGVTAGASN